MNTIELRLRGVPGAVPEARRAVDRLQDEAAPHVLENMRLLVSELLTNSVRHADLGKNGEIRLRIMTAPDRFRIGAA